MNRHSMLKLISVVLLLSMVLAACAPAATPAPAAPAAQPAATAAPKATEAPKAAEAPKATEAPKPTTAPAAPTAAPKAAEAAKPVEVKYTMMFAIQKDIKVVEDAINAALAKKGINIVVRLAPFEDAAFTEKMNLSMAAGEACDIVWVAPWMAPTFSQLVINGSLLPLDDLLPKNAVLRCSRTCPRRPGM